MFFFWYHGLSGTIRCVLRKKNIVPFHVAESDTRRLINRRVSWSRDRRLICCEIWMFGSIVTMRTGVIAHALMAALLASCGEHTFPLACMRRTRRCMEGNANFPAVLRKPTRVCAVLQRDQMKTRAKEMHSAQAQTKGGSPTYLAS